MKKILLIFAVLLALGAVCLIAAVLLLMPVNASRVNPPVVQEPLWDSPQTREIAKRACFDCHSNETVWPWYSNLPLVGALVERDVNEGREKLNFSQWGSGEQEVEEIVEVVQEGEMPLPIYLPMHPEARLTTEEKQTLIQGFQATFGASLEGEYGREDDD